MVSTAGPGPAARSRNRGQQTRDLVLDTALQLLTERGYLEVRVEDIANEAGWPRATFYTHFAEREQVLAELFERLLGDEVGPEPFGPPGSGSSEQQVTALAQDAVRQMLVQEQLARFVYSLPARHRALLRPGARTTTAVFDQVTALLEQGAPHGQVRADLPVALLSRHVLAALEIGMRDWAQGRLDDPQAHLGRLLELSFHGVTPC